MRDILFFTRFSVEGAKVWQGMSPTSKILVFRTLNLCGIHYFFGDKKYKFKLFYKHSIFLP